MTPPTEDTRTEGIIAIFSIQLRTSFSFAYWAPPESEVRLPEMRY
jgi:hypothetical protein